MASSSASPATDGFKSKWHDSIVNFIRESQEKTLDLEEAKLGTAELNFLFKFLPHSQVTELNLDCNNLQNRIKEFSEVLVKTKIRKLNVLNCGLTNEDLFHLLEVLKDTKITELIVDSDDTVVFNEKEEVKFISCLLKSNLTIFDFNVDLFDYDGKGLLFQALPNTSITKLNITNRLNNNILISLFFGLHRSSLTDLQLRGVDVDKRLLHALSGNLGNSKLKKLDLASNKIDDDAVDILVKGLIQSKIVDLDLSHNQISGSNTLGLRLKETCITKLDLSNNKMEQHGIFLSPDFLESSLVTDLRVHKCQLSDKLCLKLLESLKFSKVSKLKISSNNLQKVIISKLSQIMKDTKLEEIDFSSNNLTADALNILGECIKVSNLSSVDLSKSFKYPDIETILPAFLAKIKGSSIHSLNLSGNELNEIGAKTVAIHIANSALTHLDLSDNEIGNGIISIAEHLKFTALVKLCVFDNKITDEGAEALAQHLNETQLIDLNLNYNDVTNHGAEALAHALKNSSLLYLGLWDCVKIGSGGIKALAKGAKGTFITFLDVLNDTEEDTSLLDSILWENKASLQRLVRTFKKISPQTVDGNFRFDENTDAYLESCLELYMNITQKPSAVSALLEEKSITLCKEDISLVFEKFPNQFRQFISSCVGADVVRQIKLLKSAEKKGLDRIVRFLLLNRHSYLMDEKEGILHPIVYKLLNKHDYSLYDFFVEPVGRRKIINYFLEHLDIEGASDVINLLRAKEK